MHKRKGGYGSSRKSREGRLLYVVVLLGMGAAGWTPFALQ